MADRLELEARFKDHASKGVKALGKTLGEVKPSNGMEAASKWMQGFRKEADSAVRVSRNMPGVLSGIGIGGLAASMSLGALARSLKSAADNALDLREIGRESGMAAVEIQRLQYAAGKLHVDPSKVTGAIDQWSGKMVEFRRHVGPFYTEMMRQNSDVARKIASEDPAKGFRDTLDFLSRIPAAAIKAGASAADAAQIQKRWAEEAGLGDMVPALAKGPEGIRDAMAEAAQNVRPISQEMIAAAERMNESTNRFNQTWTNLINRVGPSLIDPLTGAIEKMDDAFKEGEKLFSRGAPEEAPPSKPDGTPSESASGYLARTLRNTLRVEFSGDNQMTKDGQWLWKTLFGSSEAHAGEMPAGGLPRRVLPPAASDKWIPSRYDREARARAGGLPAGPGGDLQKEVRDGSKAGIIAGLRELAQQQELGGGGSGVGETTGGALNLRYGRPGASGGYRTTPGRHSAGSAGGDHGASGPVGVDYNAKSALDQMGISKGEWDAFREGVTDIEGKRYDRMGGGGGRYAGRYQMGPAEITATAARLGVARPTNAQFLSDPAMQERFFENYTMDHRRSLMHNPKFAAMSAREQLKILGYAHNQGAGGPANHRHGANGAWGYLENGRAGHDGFGTSGAAYPQKIQRRLDQLDRGAAADAFKARQKALLGTPPQAHAAGGAVRGSGGPRSDSIPAWLSNGEFVVNAGAAGRFGPLLHAINDGRMPAYADGGPVGFGVDRRFYPTSSPKISEAEGAGNRRFWRDFFRRPQRDGGMGAPWRTTLAALAMMQGESGRGLNSKAYGWDVNGPSGGVDQLHDVTTGRGAGRLHRLSDLMKLAYLQHVDWRDPSVQAANFKREALGGMNFAWRRMLAAKTARGALKEGIDKFENPAQHDLELRRRLPNVLRLQREAVADRVASPQELGPLDVTIRHHPHTGKPIVSARAGKGMRLRIRTGQTMQPT